MPLILFLLLCFTLTSGAAPVQQFKGVHTYQALQGNWSRHTEFTTWPGGANLFKKRELIYRFYPGAISPSTCDITGDYIWYHITPSGGFVVDWSIHYHAWPGMPPVLPWITEGVNLGYLLPGYPSPDLVNRYITGPGFSEDTYSLSGLTLTNNTGVPQLFTLNYVWDRTTPYSDVPCWTRYVVQPYSFRQVVPSMQNCLLREYDIAVNVPIGTLESYVWSQPYNIIPRSQNPMALADNCTGASLTPPSIPTFADIEYWLSPSGGIYNPWPIPPE